MSKSDTGVNLMAGKKPICPILQKNYELRPEYKKKFLETAEAKLFFKNLPPRISRILKRGFLLGKHGSDIPEWKEVADYFKQNSDLIPALIRDPGTSEILEAAYRFDDVRYDIDKYLTSSLAGGPSLIGRYKLVTAESCSIIENILKKQEECLVVDFGSGPGRNAIDILKSRPDFRGRIKIECIDIDRVALEKGKSLSKEYGFEEIEFIGKSMADLKERYRGNIDFGLLIGVLCGMNTRERIVLLKVLRRYFKPNGLLLTAALLEKMALDDLLCAYVLRETTGWTLQYRPLGELKEAFEKAGWKYLRYSQEEPTKFYEIGTGSA